VNLCRLAGRQKDVETRSVVESGGTEVLTEARSIQRTTSLLRSRHRRTAGPQDRDHDDSLSEQLLARQERVRDTGTHSVHYPLSQVSIAVQQAEGDPAVSAVEGRTDDGGLSRLRLTVSAVSNGEDKRLRPDRSHLGERIRPVGDRPSNEDHRPGVEQTIRNEADNTRVPTRSDRLRSREDRRAVLT